SAIALHQSGQLKEAATIYKQVLDTDPANVDALHLLGLVSHQSGQSTTAIALIKRALVVSPDHPDFLRNLANILRESGKFEEAIQVCRRIIELQPRSAEGYYELGVNFQIAGQLQQSALAYQKSIDIYPDDSKVHVYLAAVLLKLKKFGKAIDACQKAIQISSENFLAYNILGNIYKEQGKLEEAIRFYQYAISIQPNVPEIHSNLGDAFKESNRLDEAIQVYLQAIEIKPNIAQVHANIGFVFYQKLVDLENTGSIVDSLMAPSYLDRVVQSYQRAIKIDPDCPAEVYNNFGLALNRQGEFQPAVRAYQKALETDPNYAEAHNNLGLVLLLTGDFESGWRECEWRWKCPAFPSRTPNFPQPLWKGQDIGEKTILVWGEQGVGDRIMYVSLLPKFQQQAHRVLVETQQRLVPLFRRSFPEISFFRIQDPPNSKLLEESIDYQLPIGSLARWLLPDEESFPKNTIYLKACVNKVKELRDKYQQLESDKLLIGISWKSVNKDIGKLKSTFLTQWRDLLSQKDCLFINLQYGDVEEEINAFTAQTGISIYQDRDIDSLKDLDGFAAQVSALDLIISTSNTTVHMAGALGNPVWTLLHYVPDWRWQLDRLDTP
ncbi:MAG: tetratricopeptide repeat protein, partial [Candidatus Poribacteria bacterium]|nr:tetratricopeptide repeat protein [Candidatus Poribacteria bacterium]